MPVESKPAEASETQRLMAGLYIVATPIGNLKDITLRALETLQRADVIACEDTRTSGVLMRHYGIETRRIAYHEHNAEQSRPELLEMMRSGKAIALISDAGTPLISDPGYKLVVEARAAGLYVTTLPGASSVMAALTLAGQPTDRFLFAGFLPSKALARRKVLEEVSRMDATLVFMESPHRLADTLAAMGEVFGDRPCSITRELTKHFEEVIEGDAATLAGRIAQQPVKGELVLVVGPPREEVTGVDEVQRLLVKYMAEQSLKDAVQQVATITGVARAQVYQMALALRHDA